MKKDMLYSICCLAFAIIIGGAVYEHLNVVPQWSAAPPASLSMFQGKYGLKPGLFWEVIHPVNLLLFVLTLILYWKTARRKNILIVLTGYFLILVVTWVYFVPELISIITTPFSQASDPDLMQRAKTWEILSIARLVILVVLSLVLFTGSAKAHKVAEVIPGRK